MSLRRRITFSPAYDERHTDPTKNYGWHGVDVFASLIDDELQQAVTIVWDTGWHYDRALAAHANNDPQFYGRYITWHRLVERDEDVRQGPCNVLDKEFCWGGYTGLFERMDPIVRALLREGEKGLWRELEVVYNRLLMPDTHSVTFSERAE